MMVITKTINYNSKGNISAKSKVSNLQREKTCDSYIDKFRPKNLSLKRSKFVKVHIKKMSSSILEKIERYD